ncbi:hypothetical protein HKX48_002137 [Thoreauomyces humboldtii]|nr:hypothetical protein HKX48_002137 [Thoreauomyces humboldtii]
MDSPQQLPVQDDITATADSDTMTIPRSSRSGSMDGPLYSSREPRRDSAITVSESKRKSPSECNRVGLNGLNGSGLTGLDSGLFTVEEWMPMRYTVEITPRIFDEDNTSLLRTMNDSVFPPILSAYSTSEAARAGPQRRLVLIDSTVYELYRNKIDRYFAHHGVQVIIHLITPDEANKDWNQVLAACTTMQKCNIDRRREPILAIGGGVSLDLSAMAANLYRRGTPIIKVPTTLIGMVDAAVGVKTACNLNGGKNKIGTYCAPLAVFVDTSFLATLPERHIRNGSAEIAKMACIKDARLFELMEEMVQHPRTTRGDAYLYGGEEIMRRAIQGMLEELEPNLHEFNLRRIVDYGHSFSPCLEMAALGTDMSLLHGEAVCIDMAFTTVIARRRGLLSDKDACRTLRLMQGLGLATSHPSLDIACCAKALEDITAGRGGFQRTPLMRGIGAATFVDDMTIEELALALDELNRVSF